MTESAPVRSGARYRRILRFALRALLQTWWFELALPKLGLRKIAQRTFTARMTRFARGFRDLAVDLGGLMIKLGQFMSSRLDVLPPEITRELAGLQDAVPPVPFAEVRALAERELGVPLATAYASFAETPLAAASLGQAHRATLSDEDARIAGFGAVVVKVQRPGIEQIIEVDLAALRRVASWLSRVRIVSDHVDAPALVEEFAKTSFEEIDYLHEAASAERFAEDFAEHPQVEAPEIVWERTTRRVLTLADVTAIKIDDVAGLEAAGIDPKEVAQVFASTMFEQLFSHGRFHADPHPGNIFVTPGAPVTPGLDGEPWRLTFIDFGMMGEVSDTMRDGLRRVLVAVATRDSRGLIAGISEVGVLLPAADTGELERAMRELFARFGGMGVSELRAVDPDELLRFSDEFGEVVRSLPFQLPENFLLAIRAMSLTSGVCSSLDPEFNIWDAVEPFAGRLVREESGNAVQAFAKSAVEVAGLAVGLPVRIDALITRFEEGRVTVSTPDVSRRLSRIERLVRRAVWAVLFAGVLVAGALLRPNDETLGTVLMWASLVPLLGAVFTRRVP